MRGLGFLQSFLRIVGYLLVGGMYTMQLNHWVAAWYGGWGTLVVSEVVGFCRELRSNAN